MMDVPVAEGLPAIEAREAGFDADRLAEAIGFACANESTMNRDIGRALEDGYFGDPGTYGEVIGPARPRGDPSGMILRSGRVVASWGPVCAPDMTFSIAKSYLAICAGIAWDDGLIRLDDPAGDIVPDLFASPQNRAITWRHLLQLTSEWEGELWGKPDQIDRHRSTGRTAGTSGPKGSHRALQAPGAFWEYNDVRVNVLAYALTRVFGRPLPEVLDERIMRPIGASRAWEWHGYRTSWVEIGGRRIQSVAGGAHWGGGMFIPTTDHARVGLLMLNRGRWGERQLLSEEWVEQCVTPCALNPNYGFLWWLNRDRTQCPPAPASSFFALGVGRNAIWIDPGLDLVAVVRWIEADAFSGFAERVMAAM